MKKYTHCFFIIGIAAAVSAAFSSAAFAEGSADLVKNGGNRPYLEWRDRQNFGLQRKSVIYVYAEKGERIYFGSSVWRSSERALKSVLSDNPNDVTGSIGNDMTGATVAITLPAEVGGMPYDLTGASISNFKWRGSINENLQAGDTGIYLTRPDPNDSKRGYIANPEQEKVGPHIDDNTKGGYEPFSFTAPVTGTYAFRFLSNDYQSNDPTAKETGEGWASGDLGGSNYTSSEGNSTVAAWDITVVGTDNQKKTGRVWTDVLFLNTGDYTTPVNSEVYALTYDGFEYRVNLNGIEPFGFTLYSNNRGPLIDMYNMAQPDGNRPIGENGKEVNKSFDYLRSLCHSFYSYTSTYDVGPGPVRTEKDDNGHELTDYAGKPVKSTILNNFIPVDSDRDSTHKIFFNKPGQEAITAYTKNGLITNKNQITTPENQTNIKYVGEGYAAVNENGISYGTLGIGGSFKVTLNDGSDLDRSSTNIYRIVLDFSKYALDDNNRPIIKDGEWVKRIDLDDKEQKNNEKNNIVVLVKVLEDNEEEIQWDGQDIYGNNVPVGVYESIGTSYWEIGSAHFPLMDVENNPNGIIIERMNEITGDNDSEEKRYTVYYNNEANVSKNPNLKWYYAGVNDGNYPTMGDGLNMLQGANSKGGAMKYGESGGSEQPGNYTVLDIWSRYVVQDKTNITIGVRRLDRTNPSIVSFVAADGVTGISGTFDQSHVKQNGKTLWSYEDTGNRGDTKEEKIYGNTMSTGFTATVSSESIENYGYNYITWDITIPMTGQEYTYNDERGEVVEATAEPSYIKIPSENGGVNAQNEEIIMSIAEMFGEGALDQEVSTGSEGEIEDLGSDPAYAEEEFDSGLTAVSLYDAEGNEQPYDNNKVWDIGLKLAGKPVLEDTASKVNNGDIYEITGIEDAGTDTYTKLQLKLAYELPATVSGGVSVTYGIIIDNLYAPSAVAKAGYTAASEKGYQNLDNSGNAVKADDLEAYENHENNGYTSAGTDY